MDINNYVQNAMDIAHEKSHSIMSQRYDFERLVRTIIEESKEKLTAQLQEDRLQREREEWDNPRL